MDETQARDDELSAAQARIAALETELAASQARARRLERLIAAAQDGIGVHQDGILTDCNTLLEQLLGYSRQELIGELIWRFIPAARHAQVRAMIEAGFEGYYEFEAIRRDGSVFPVEAFVSNVPDPAGICRVFSLHDLTQHRRIEADLRRSEALYRMLADNSSDVIWTLDLQGRFTYVSPAVERLRGYTAEEVMRQTMDEALTPASQKLASARLQTVIASVTAGSRESLQTRMELEQPCKNGTTVWTEVIASVMYDEDGEFLGILGATRDITRQRQMRETLSRERQLLRTLLDNLPASVYIKDLDGRFLLNNVESLRRMGLTSQAETLGKMTADFYPEVAARWDAVEREVVETGQPQIHEDVMVWRSGEQRWVQASYIPLQDEQGEIIGVLGLNQDVTERREAARRALDLEMERERSQVLERFLGDASHDLKTPLTTMRVSLAVLKRDPPLELRDQHVDILEVQVAHFQTLLDDLLNLTRMERHLELSLRHYDLNMMIRDVVAEAGPLIEQQQHALVLELHPAEPRFLFDYEQLSRAVSAVLINAINYTPPGGRLVLRTGLEDDQVMIAVEDNGIGIAAVDQPYVFERFFRADRARSTRSGGMGLGLAIARKIVEAHGGRIIFKSVLNVGSAFTIWLPLSMSAPDLDENAL